MGHRLGLLRPRTRCLDHLQFRSYRRTFCSGRAGGVTGRGGWNQYRSSEHPSFRERGAGTRRNRNGLGHGQSEHSHGPTQMGASLPNGASPGHHQAAIGEHEPGSLFLPRAFSRNGSVRLLRGANPFLGYRCRPDEPEYAQRDSASQSGIFTTRKVDTDKSARELRLKPERWRWTKAKAEARGMNYRLPSF